MTDNMPTGEARLYAERNMHSAAEGGQVSTYYNMRQRFPNQTHGQLVWVVAMLHGHMTPEQQQEVLN